MRPPSRSMSALYLTAVPLLAAGGCAHGPPTSSGSAALSGGPGKVELLAGGGTGGDGSPALQAKLNDPFAVARDGAGNLFIAEHLGNRLRKLDTAGIVTTVAGTGEKSDGGDDGPGTAAKLNGPHHVLVRTEGGPIYIADTFNNRVRTLDPATGMIRALAGTGTKAFSGDGGQAMAAEFSGVFCLDLDRQGKRLYVMDLGNKRVRAVDLGSGMVTTIAGNGEKGVPADGTDALQRAAVRPAGHRRRLGRPPVHPGAQRQRPAGGGHRRQDPHRGRQRPEGLLGRRRPRAAGPDERPQAPHRRPRRQRADRRHREPRHPPLRSAGTAA